MEQEAKYNHPLSRFVVTPNCSMTWRDNKIFVASLATISFGIAGAFAMQGLWMILPFAGIEIIFLTVILYLCCLRATQCEVISIDADNIQIEVGRQKAREIHSFQRAWTSVELYSSQTSNEQSRLIIRSKGKELEIGACLSELDRKSLASSIKQALC